MGTLSAGRGGFLEPGVRLLVGEGASALPAVQAFSSSEGCMLCLGQSTFLRFNHPAEAKWMKSMIPAGGRAPEPPYSPGPGRDAVGQVVLPWMVPLLAPCSSLAATVMAPGEIQEVLLGWNRDRMPGPSHSLLSSVWPSPSLTMPGPPLLGAVVPATLIG